MRKYILLCLASMLTVLLTTILSQCTLKNYVDIAEQGFGEEIATQQNLNFTFNRDIVSDSLINVWDTTQYVQFEPKIQGKFKWTSPRTVIFSPMEGFKPSTNYKAKLTSALNTKSVPANKDKVIEFHTSYLKLENSDIFWTKDQRLTKQLRINLSFNYKVKPKSLESLISANMGEQAFQNIQVLNSNDSKIVELLIEEPAQNILDNQSIEINIATGLQCAESDFKTKKAITQKLTVPNKNQLLILGMYPKYEDKNGVISVKTNQTIPLQEIVKNIKVRPNITFEVVEANNGFMLKGRFRSGNTYTVTLDDKVKSVLGVKLRQDYQQSITFGELRPSIKFTQKGSVYLTSKGNRNIGVNIHNVPEVEVKVYKVYENNLLHFLRERVNHYDYNSVRTYSLQNYAGIVFNRTYKTKTLAQVENFRVLNLDLADLKGKNKGVYVVTVSSTKEQYLKDAKLVSISDIGFMVKESKNDILVFANSLLSAKSLKGAKISLISESNQVLERQDTDENGIVVFKNVKNKHAGIAIPMLSARYGEDYNYLYLNKSKIDKSSFETGGIRENSSGYQAFLYSERDLYRPSEKLNFNIVVRDRKWKTVPKLPVKFVLKLPNGNDFVSQKGILNTQGAFETFVTLPQSAITGTYQAQVYTLTGLLLGSMPISVEEFMPDRIKVKVSMVQSDFKTRLKEPLKSGEKARVFIQAKNLFGPPVADNPYQLNFSLRRKNFKAKGYESYNFDLKTITTNKNPFSNNNNPFYNLISKFNEGDTDENGEVKETFEIPKEYKNMGLLEATAYATVFDETGRSVSRFTRQEVSTQDIFVGIKDLDYYVSTDRVLPISFVALSTQGLASSAYVKVEIIRYRWETVVEKDYSGNLKYVSKKQEEVIKAENLNIGTVGNTVNFTPRLSGNYEIRAFLPNADTYVAKSFYAYGYYSTNHSSFEVKKDGRVSIKLDKPKYKIGEEAKVLFTTPFDGKLLISVERNDILEYHYLTTNNKTASKTFTVTEDFLPNVYITAILIKPLSDGAIPLTVAHGFEPLFAEKPESKLDLKIEAVAKSESRQKQTIKVKTNRLESDIQVTLAVVDEGILQLKNYQTPDIHGFFFQKRSLETNTYDIYPQLLPEITLNKSLVGGGGPALNRSNPMVNRRVKLVSFWSGILKTDANGEVSYTIDIPEYSGSLRIMAIAYKDGKFGSAQKSMTVADPIVLSTGLPRFLSPKDKITVPVTLFNTTENSTQAIVSLSTSDNLKILGKSSFSKPVAQNNEAMVEFEIQAKSVIDSAKIKVRVSAMGRKFEQNLDINIRPPVSVYKQASSGVVKGGSSSFVDIKADIVPSTLESKLILSNSPVVQFAGSLDYLISYPYGCVEQITSSAFPQLYVQDLMKAITPNTVYVQGESEIRRNINQAILTLQSRQNYEGALSYWAGGYESHWFGTAYASHFMLEAQKAGYEVNGDVLDNMLNYLKSKVTNNYRKRDYYYYDEKGKRHKKVIFPKEAAYALYILTLAEKEELGTMNYFKENTKYLALDSKYLLASAYLLVGDRESYNDLLPSAFEGEQSEQVLDNSFHSYIRDEALALNALLEANPENPQVATMAQHLSKQLKSTKYLNTQERSFSLLALGKISKQANQSDIVGQVFVDGTNLGNYSNGQTLTLREGFANKSVNIKAEGQGSLYYFWEMAGLSASGKVKEEDKNLKVRRTFYNQYGRKVTDNTFRQNDLVIVKVSVVAEPYFQNIKNVVLTDMLPAGLEIENPRVTQSRSIRWIKNSTYAEHFDVRDDRINYFVTVSGKVKHYYYLARAVTKGTYQLGPVSADAMYDGSYYSYHGAGTVSVIDRKSGVN